MYTVLRVYGNKSTLEAVGTEINLIIPGGYDGIDGTGSRFSVTLSDNDIWWEHQEEVKSHITKIIPVIRKYNGIVNFEIDVGFFCDEHRGISIYEIRFDHDLLRILCEHDLSLVFTIWGTAR